LLGSVPIQNLTTTVFAVAVAVWSSRHPVGVDAASQTRCTGVRTLGAEAIAVGEIAAPNHMLLSNSIVVSTLDENGAIERVHAELTVTAGLPPSVIDPSVVNSIVSRFHANAITCVSVKFPKYAGEPERLPLISSGQNGREPSVTNAVAVLMDQ